MEKLVIVRTNPEQGKPVKVSFNDTSGGRNDPYGFGEFPFPLWLQFEKLLKEALELRARQEPREARRIEVEFTVPFTPIVTKAEVKEIKQTEKLVKTLVED